MNVNYEYYRLFYYVCKYHSITRAANVLRMSQPNVTRALNRLEEQLGCKLLVRSTRGVTMTQMCIRDSIKALPCSSWRRVSASRSELNCEKDSISLYWASSIRRLALAFFMALVWACLLYTSRCV